MRQQSATLSLRAGKICQQSTKSAVDQSTTLIPLAGLVAFCCWRKRRSRAKPIFAPAKAGKAKPSAQIQTVTDGLPHFFDEHGNDHGPLPPMGAQKTDVMLYSQYRKSRLESIRSEMGLHEQGALTHPACNSMPPPSLDPATSLGMFSTSASPHALSCQRFSLSQILQTEHGQQMSQQDLIRGDTDISRRCSTGIPCDIHKASASYNMYADTPSPRSVLDSHASLGPGGLTGALMAEHSPSVTGSDESVLDGLASAYFHAPSTSRDSKSASRELSQSPGPAPSGAHSPGVCQKPLNLAPVHVGAGHAAGLLRPPEIA